MINRSLIRIKTVQILYSYLLTRNDFKLETPPAATDGSSDRKFAYSVYLDLLILLLKLSSVPLGPGAGVVLEADAALKKNRIGRALRDDPAMALLLAKNRDRLAKFDTCVTDLATAVADSAVYKDYKRKRKLQMADDVAFWNTVFSTVVRKHKGVERVLRRDEAFSHVGFDMGVKMLVSTLSTFDDTRATYLKARADLDKSLTLAYDLYHALLLLPLGITRLQEQRLDEAKHKYLPTPEDLNPNLRFVDNLYVRMLENCEALKEDVDEHPEADPASWRDSDLLFASLLDLITASDAYKEYMESEPGDFARDAAFWRDIMKTIVFPSDELADTMETMSVFWNDDIAIMSTFALKTMRRSYASLDNDSATEEDGEELAGSCSGGSIELLPKFMNEDDEAFGAELFEFVIQNRDKYRALIDGFIDTTQWDTERLAYMDIVIMMAAIAEIINYPSIPLPVTLNEYIEIANDYSTARSGSFVNGILYSVVKKLGEEGVITKK